MKIKSGESLVSRKVNNLYALTGEALEAITLHVGPVSEQIAGSVGGGDETETLGLVEEFHSASDSGGEHGVRHNSLGGGSEERSGEHFGWIDLKK